MKRLLCIVIAAAAAFMLTACGSAAPEADGDTVQTAETEYGFQVVTEVISEEAYYKILSILLNVVDSGTGNRLRRAHRRFCKPFLRALRLQGRPRL